MKVHSMSVIRFLMTILLLGSLSACQFNPYEHVVVPGIDDLHAPDDEKPSKADLKNERLVVAALPSSLEVAGVEKGVGTLLMTEFIKGMRGTGKLEVVDSGEDYQRALSQQMNEASGLYSQSGGAALGKRLRANYVCWPTLTAFASRATQLQDKKGNIFYQIEAAATVVLKLVDVETGSYVLNESRSASDTEITDTPPTNVDLLALARAAAIQAARDLQPAFGRAFPVLGYVAELRGERSVARVEIPDVSTLQHGTHIVVVRRVTKVDPVSGDLRTSMHPIAELVVRLVDHNGIWCSVEGGRELIRLGHPAMTQGRGTGFLYELRTIFEND